MSKKRIISIIAAATLVTTLFAGCGAKENTTPSGDTSKQTAAKIKVGLVTDQGGVNDGSFNQSAREGIDKAAKELGIEALNPIESKQQDQYEPNLKTMASAADLVVGCGYMMQQAMQNVSGQASDKKFLIVDAEVKNPNVLSILFKEQEGSFLAGVAAAKTTKTGKIGFIGGGEAANNAVINRFETGFAAGVASVNADMAKGLMPKNDNTPGTSVIYIGSFDDQGKGYEAAKTLYNSGVDIIYHAAGGAGLGVFKAAKEMGKYAIGVDSDQAVTAPGYKDVILFSVEKKVGVAAYDTIKELQAGNFAGGTTKTLGIKEEAVGLAPTINEAASKDGIELSKKAEEMIKSGTIVVPGTRAELLNFKPVEIK